MPPDAPATTTQCERVFPSSLVHIRHTSFHHIERRDCGVESELSSLTDYGGLLMIRRQTYAHPSKMRDKCVVFNKDEKVTARKQIEKECASRRAQKEQVGSGADSRSRSVSEGHRKGMLVLQYQWLPITIEMCIRGMEHMLLAS